MFPAFLLPLLGAGLGAATSRKPLKGALLGAGMGALGGYGAGLLGGAGAAGGANPLASYMTTGGVEGSILGGGTGGAAGSVGGGGLFGQLKGAASAAKPFTDAAGTAMQVQGLFSPAQSMPVAPQQANPQAAQSLPQLVQSLEQSMMEHQKAEMERRQRRQSLLGVQ